LSFPAVRQVFLESHWRGGIDTAQGYISCADIREGPNKRSLALQGSVVWAVRYPRLAAPSFSIDVILRNLAIASKRALWRLVLRQYKKILTLTKILVVDDTRKNIIALEAMLEEIDGIQVTTASSGKECLKHILANDFAVILMDINMPGMDGFETAAFVRARPRSKDTPIIFVTAHHGEKQEVSRGYSLGAVDYIIKPINPEILKTKVRVFLKLYRNSREIERQGQLLRKVDRKKHEREQAEKELLRKSAEKALELRSAFIANMSHEIRTPMNSVIGMASLLETTNLSLEQREYAQVIKGAGEALLSIINDILDLSKIEAKKLELQQQEISILQVVSDVVSMFSEQVSKKKLYLHSMVDGQIPMVIGDYSRLRQILTNVIGNAVKFTESGEISVRAKITENDGDDASLLIEVRDSGPGIAELDQIKIFEPFGQSGRGSSGLVNGTGLGLAICKNLCKAMGGDINVQSELGSGSTFRFSLKLPIKGNGEGCESAALLKGKSALVVASELSTSSNLCEQLESWGFESIALSSARSALEELMAKELGQRPIDLIIVDHKLIDMDGCEFATRAHKERNLTNTQMILMQPVFKRDPSLDERARAAGFSFLVNRPLNGEELKAKIIQAFDKESLGSRNLLVHNQGLEVGKFSEKRILLVDDNPGNINLATKMIKKLGHRVTPAKNGQEAIELFCRKEFDLILMDCQMPVMNGFQATTEIRRLEKKSGRRIPIIALTAGVLADYNQRSIDADMDDFLAKPMTFTSFTIMINKWFELTDNSQKEARGRHEKTPGVG
jgi:two-component system, sensor histidine kinase and response regulator